MKKFVSLMLILAIFTSCLITVSYAVDDYYNNTTEVVDTLSQSTAFLDSNVYAFSGAFVYSVPQNTTVSAFISNFTTKNISIVNKTSGIIASGDKVTNGTDTCTVSVRGDINGDGKVTVTDVTNASDITVGNSTYKSGSVGYFSADVDNNGTINVVDVSKIVALSLNK